MTEGVLIAAIAKLSPGVRAQMLCLVEIIVQTQAEPNEGDIFRLQTANQAFRTMAELLQPVDGLDGDAPLVQRVADVVAKLRFATSHIKIMQDALAAIAAGKHLPHAVAKHALFECGLL